MIRYRPLIALVAAVCLGGLLTTPATAEAPTGASQQAGASSTGTISGKITQASDGSDAENVCALVYAASDTYDYDAVGGACSDDRGDYSVDGLSAGQYLIQFVDGDTSRHDVPQWWNGKSSSDVAAIIKVDAGSTVTVNPVMQAGGWITGTVTDSVTGDPITNECLVKVYDNDGDDRGGLAYVDDDQDSAEAYVDYGVCTDDSGHYITGGMAPGKYTLSFNEYGYDESYAAQWYDNEPAEDSADAVEVTIGQGRSADAALEPTPTFTVSGTVTDSSGSGIENVDVYFYNDGGYVDDGYTNGDGAYSIDVPKGSYQVRFFPPSDSGYTDQWYNDKPDQGSADTLAVTGNMSGINATLAKGGTITGTVTDQGSGTGLSGIDVEAYTQDYQTDVYATTGDDGRYTLTGLPGGSYTVEFSGDPYNDPDTSAYLSQYYDGHVATDDAISDPVSVTAGSTTDGIDATMAKGATISGTITDAATGAPLSNICVYPMPTANDGSGYYGGTRACTDGEGHYTTAGVPSGSYKLDYTNYNGRYIEQWYDNQPDSDNANTVEVTQPEAKSGYDVTMHLGGDISGTVTAQKDSSPLSGICVKLTPVGGGTTIDGGCTADDGTYTTSSVPGGQYDVQFIDDSGVYTSQYYNQEPDLAHADPVTVNVGQTTSGVDAQLSGQTVPGAPTNVQATAGDAAATVTFDAPASTGGSPITGYAVIPSPACDGCTGTTTASTSATVKGLENGTAYTFTVTATNSTGTGPASEPSNAVTPTPSGGGTVSAPGAPTNVSATVNVSQVKVSYSAPASDGGAPITGYAITPSPACGSCAGLTSTGTSSTITGLTTGQAYTFTVAATNSAGTSDASAPSNAVTPTAEAQSPESASTNDPSQAASVTNNGTTATASGGTGTVTVAQYPGIPAAAPTFDPAGSYLDVSVTHASTFTSVLIKDCNLHTGISLYWWDPIGGVDKAGRWEPVLGDPTDTSGLPGCLSVTIDSHSSPRIDQLNGTIFGVGNPQSTPSAPRQVTATAGDGQASLTWNPPADEGSSPIIGYQVTTEPGGASEQVTGTMATITDLTNGTTYTFSVAAVTSVGTGPAATSNPVTPTGCTSRPYDDVPVSSTFCGDIRWLKAQHITKGYLDGGFHPTAKITRQAMAAFIYRLSNPGKADPICTGRPYDDVPVSSTFCGDIRWLKAQHITKGYLDGGFHPTAKITRQAMAAFLHRMATQ